MSLTCASRQFLGGVLLLLTVQAAAMAQTEPPCPLRDGEVVWLEDQMARTFGLFGAARVTQEVERAGEEALGTLLDQCGAMCPGTLSGRVWVDTEPSAIHERRHCPSEYLGSQSRFQQGFDQPSDANRWVQDILRARNEEGRALLDSCPGYCSYAVSVNRVVVESGMIVTMNVVCVPPRRTREWIATYSLELHCEP